MNIDHQTSSYHEEHPNEENYDPNCGSKFDSSERTGSSCKPGVTIEEVNAEDPLGSGPGLVAQYETDDGCTTSGDIDRNNDDVVISAWTQDPTTSTCAETDPGVIGPEYCEGINYYNTDDEMEYVEYYAEPEYFRQKADVDEIDLETQVMSTKFVTDSGLRPIRQTLLQAEQEYNNEGFDAEHDVETWDGRITANTTAGGEEEPVANYSYEPETANNTRHLEAWTPANAGVRNDAVLSSDDGEEEVFRGGFAGECPDGQYWTYDTQQENMDWRCGGDIGWEQPVLLPTSSVDDLIGLVIPHTNFMTEDQLEDLIFENNSVNTRFVNYREAVPNNDDEEWGDLQDVEMTCYDAPLSEARDGNYNNSYSASTGITQDESVGMFVNMSDDGDFDGGYSCEWSYETQNRPERIQNIGNIIEMHNEQTNVSQQHIEFYDGLERSYNSFDQFERNVIDEEDFEMIEAQ